MQEEDDDFFNQCQNIETLDYEDEMMFREMMHQPAFSSNLVINNNNFNGAPQKLATATSPMAYILSFDDSTVVSAAGQTYGGKQPYHDALISGGGGGSTLPPSKEKVEILEPSRVHQTTRKVRSSSETLDHIVAERKRRRELTERFIALSATIPGLKKVRM
ncbi:putative transcription factor bHLH family [Lupinus albus]|uniref:Putative transcription factor bHLH family n=1 Tax=Lupinus albus TaxID=3870 RepID=A0A6A4ND14_LUPAL|nr:putative transcription factor bHLH family [Lupinus albus]